MSNFIDDLTSLPAGKTDAPGGSISVPAGQKVTAAEWNSVMQALVDTRGAILDGKVHGLMSNPAEGVSAADGVKLRNSQGAFEVSEDGSAFKGVATVFNVKAYGAKGDGTTDDAAAIQSALTAAVSTLGTVYFPAGTYRVNTELSITAGVCLAGAPAKILAGAAITSVANIVGFGSVITDIYFDGAYLATYAARSSGGLGSAVFKRVGFTRSLTDGWRQFPTSSNGNCLFEKCIWTLCGTNYRTTGFGAMGGGTREVVATGTVATSIGSQALVGTDTAFTTMGIRAGDLICVGTGVGREYLQIAAVVDDTHLTLDYKSTPVNTRSGMDFAIGVGDGYREDPYADSNINKITGGLVRSVAGCALVFGGFYGPVVHGTQIDSIPNGYGVRVGHSGAGCMNALLEGIYVEDCAAGGFYLCWAPGVVISACVDAGLSAGVYDGAIAGALPPKWRAADTGRAQGVWLGSSRFTDTAAGAVDPIGGAFSNMPTIYGAPYGQTFTVGGRVVYGGDILTPVAGTTIAPAAAFAALNTSAITMTSTPTIQTAGRSLGERVLLNSYTGAGPLVLQDDSALSGSKLRLGRSALALTTGNWAEFYFGSDGFWHLIATDGTLYDTADTTGTPGNTTQNTYSGRVSIAALGTAVVITNNKITTASKVFVQLQSVDATAKSAVAVCTSNAITITLNAAATATTNLAWHLVD